MDLLYILFALDMLNLAVFLPMFGACVRSLGGTPFTIGLINSSSALISLLWNPIVGSLSDQMGRKGLLINCLLVSALGSFVMAFSPSLLLFSLGKLIGSLGSPVPILLRSVVADKYKTPDEKKTFFNKCGPFISVAFLVGSLSSGFSSEAKNGYSLAFLLMAFIMGVAIILAKRTLVNDSKENKGERKGKSPSLIEKGSRELKKAVVDLNEISWPRYRNLFIMKAAYDFGNVFFQSNLGLILMDEFGLEGRYMGYVFLMISVISIMANILKLKLQSLLDRISDSQILIIGGLAIIADFIGMSTATSVYLFLVILALSFIPRTIMDTQLTEMITTLTTEEDRGKVIAAFDNLFPFAAFVVPVLAGSLAEVFGERFIIFAGAIPMSITVIFAYNQRIKRD